jgi:hypothetical protein
MGKEAMDLASENETRVFSAYSKRKREDELVEASKRKSITSRSVDSAGNNKELKTQWLQVISLKVLFI